MIRLLALLAALALAGCSAARAEPLAQADFVLVEKGERRLTLYREGRLLKAYADIQLSQIPTEKKRFQGDKRTPEGRYTIDYRNPKSAYHLALHISYPNAADRAFAAGQGKSAGGEIFLHGQPNSWSRGRKPGDWTRGCIALSNAEIEEVWRLVPDGTEIEIRP